jgi:hypothetical protein
MFERVKRLEKKRAAMAAWRGRRGGGVRARGGESVCGLMRRVTGGRIGGGLLCVGKWHEEYGRVLEGGVGGSLRVVLAAPVQHGRAQ